MHIEIQSGGKVKITGGNGRRSGSAVPAYPGCLGGDELLRLDLRPIRSERILPCLRVKTGCSITSGIKTVHQLVKVCHHFF